MDPQRTQTCSPTSGSSHPSTRLTMTRLSTCWCTTLVMALVTAPLHGPGAQQIRPAAVANRSDSTVSDTTRQATPNVAFPPESRSGHVVNGAIGGAVLGGLFGFIAYQRDKSGDGFFPSLVIGAGAIAGALVGTVVGLLWPTR